MRIVPKRLKWLGFGAVLAWLFDPEVGRERRTRIADRASAMLRQAGQRCEGHSRYAADKLQELGHAIDPNREVEAALAPLDRPAHATSNAS